MKQLHLLFALCCCLWFSTATAHAQWQTTTYSLKGGWNAIYLTGDAPQDTLTNLFPTEVLEVWRWNTNPTQVQFMESPTEPSAGTPEWSVWKRGFPAESDFSQLTGQTAYLVRCSGLKTDSYSAAIPQIPLPPRATWVRNGANLMGFPSKLNGSYPSFSNYFATFPAAIAANSKVFKYEGGPLSPANPIQMFSMAEPLDRTKAYWFSAEVVENFQTPLEITPSNSAGLDFGSNGSIVTLRIRNRSAAEATLTLEAMASEPSPSGQPSLTAVPLTKRIFNTTTLVWDATPITAAYTETIPGSTTVELQFGIDRGAMTAGASALYGSFLRLTDGGNLMDVMLPARAQPTVLTGLWAGDIQVSAVESKVAGSPGNTTPEPFKLRTLLHLDTGGTARLLSQAFLGQLAVAPNDVGICTRESLLKQDAKAQAQRLVAAHMPLDQVITGSGTVALDGSLTCTITVPFNDPTNPFVHQYHPDHDNKDARFQAVGAGVESYDITRTCTFTFTASPPPGSGVTSGWGSSVLGGTYTETISGIHKEPITLSGTFELQRASEIGTLSQ